MLQSMVSPRVGYDLVTEQEHDASKLLMTFEMSLEKRILEMYVGCYRLSGKAL